MAKPPPSRVNPDPPEAVQPAAPVARTLGADAQAANDALLLTLVRALARQAAAEAWGEATHPDKAEPNP